jgi:hypothetical protein
LKPSGDLPRIENVMKRLSAALAALEKQGIEKRETIKRNAAFCSRT